MSSSRVILLTGAPAPSSLDPASCTIDGFMHPFSQYLGLDDDSAPGSSLSASAPRTVAAWRSLPLARRALPTSFLLSQTHALGDAIPDQNAPPWARPHFFTTVEVLSEDASVSINPDDSSDALTRFCEESLAAHDAAPSSPGPSQSFDTTGTSFDTTSSIDESSILPPQPLPGAAVHLSDLEDIPRASTVQSFAPQTITLHLIVGILSIAQPRTVTTRWGKDMALVEVLVGDDTSSGFSVTFWLPADNILSSDVTKLRRQDVVLMRNVALRVFRGKVYGQSLRGGLTKLSLLWRRDGSGHYSYRDLRKRTESPPQLEKTRQVRDWVLKFVGAPPDSSPRTTAKSWDKPPDDTQ